jgi:hypothetical protein
MSKVRFSPDQIQFYQQLPCVLKVSAKMLRFTPEFKLFAIGEHKSGRLATAIFSEAGIDISLFPVRYFYELIKTWRKSDLSVQKPKGRPPSTQVSEQEMLPDKLLARIAYLEAENDFLKKLHALDSQGQKKSSC